MKSFLTFKPIRGAVITNFQKHLFPSMTDKYTEKMGKQVARTMQLYFCDELLST